MSKKPTQKEVETRALAHQFELLRLRLLRPVLGSLPTQVIQAGDAYISTREARYKAWDALVKSGGGDPNASEVYDEALDADAQAWNSVIRALDTHRSEIDALHHAECPNCPWDGETIL